jgi:hypothetical protein
VIYEFEKSVTLEIYTGCTKRNLPYFGWLPQVNSPRYNRTYVERWKVKITLQPAMSPSQWSRGPRLRLYWNQNGHNSKPTFVWTYISRHVWLAVQAWYSLLLLTFEPCDLNVSLRTKLSFWNIVYEINYVLCIEVIRTAIH